MARRLHPERHMRLFLGFLAAATSAGVSLLQQPVECWAGGIAEIGFEHAFTNYLIPGLGIRASGDVMDAEARLG